MPLDCNDGAARRVVPVKGPDPRLRNESCRPGSPSQVRDAYGPHDGSEHTPRAIASDGAHSTQQCGQAGLVCSFPPSGHSAGRRSWCGRPLAWIEGALFLRELGVRRGQKCFRIKRLQGWACSSAGRASALQAGGHRFDPGHVHQTSYDGYFVGSRPA